MSQLHELEVKKDKLGSSLSTYRIGGLIDCMYQPKTLEETVYVLQEICKRRDPLTVIGWGGNLIIASAGIRDTTLVTRKMTWVTEVSEDCEVIFGAGVHLAKASTWAAEQKLSGAEYMIGIPGTIGGAVRMNAGALGQETSGVVKDAMLFNLETGEVETWGLSELAYQYRQSAIEPSCHIVLQVRMMFEPGDEAEIWKKMEASVLFRKTHHPTSPNGGSVFKNPYSKTSDKASMTAGWMLDSLGAKDWFEGAMRVSPLHANFIENTGEGTSIDLLKLMLRMKQAVKKEYDVDLLLENLLVGDASEEELVIWRELTGGAGVGSH